MGRGTHRTLSSTNLFSSSGDIGDDLPDTRSVGRGTHRTLSSTNLFSSSGDIGDDLPDTRSVGRGTHRTARERRNSYRRSRAINISLYSALSMAGYADEMNLLDHLLSLGHALDTCKDVQVKHAFYKKSVDKKLNPPKPIN